MKTMLFNPYNGLPRHPDEIKSDPAGLLIAEPGEPTSDQPLNRLDVACDIQTLCATGDLPDRLEVLADWVANGDMPAPQAEVVQPEPDPLQQGAVHQWRFYGCGWKDGHPSSMDQDGGGVETRVLYTKPAHRPDQHAQQEPSQAQDAPTNPPRVPRFPRVALNKLADLITGGYAVNGLSFERTDEDGTVKRGAITCGGMVLWWRPGQLSGQYEELRAAIDAGSETATHADALAWVKDAHQALSDVRGLTLTEEQCDAFRRLPIPFNDMVRAIYAAGAEHRAEPKS